MCVCVCVYIYICVYVCVCVCVNAFDWLQKKEVRFVHTLN